MIVRAIIHSMLGGDVNPYPILILVNYWEIRPASMGARLDELLRRGITQFASFVPWQAAESDISHTLLRFLQAVSERRMHVHLILTPEVGIHYPNSGLPKDVISKKENKAQHVQQEEMTVPLPPNSFTLPSLFSPEFNKRLNSFMARMDSFFFDLSKNQPALAEAVTLVLSGSLWKYYRSPWISSQKTFGGVAGDYSSHSAVTYRQRLEQFFSQKEFMDPTPSSANRWKTRAMDETNRRWFYQQSEDVFRSRIFQMVQKKSSGLKSLEIELYTPEADPSMIYSNFFQVISGGQADFSKLSSLLDESLARISLGHQTAAVPFLHWSALGGFRSLSDSEKQFLILKSLFLVGGSSGGVFIDDSEWFSLSPQFRARVESLARSLHQGELSLRSRALYLAPHLWSDCGTLWSELSQRLGSEAKIVSSLDLILKEKYSNLLIVDPSYILTREVVQKLTAWSKAGRLVVLPRSHLYSQSAKNELEKVLISTQKIEVDLGLNYTLHGLGDGKLIVYDVPSNSSVQTEVLSSWQSFLNAVLSIAEVENYCRLSDGRLSMIPFELKGEEVGIVILNGNRRQITADLIFPNPVRIKDLGFSLANAQAAEPLLELAGENRSTEQALEAEMPPLQKFSLEVPPFGILPLRVEGLTLTEVRERQLAAMNAEKTQEGALGAAMSELPGFDMDQSIEELWN